MCQPSEACRSLSDKWFRAKIFTDCPWYMLIMKGLQHHILHNLHLAERWESSWGRRCLEYLTRISPATYRKHLSWERRYHLFIITVGYLLALKSPTFHLFLAIHILTTFLHCIDIWQGQASSKQHPYCPAGPVNLMDGHQHHGLRFQAKFNHITQLVQIG